VVRNQRRWKPRSLRTVAVVSMMGMMALSACGTSSGGSGSASSDGQGADVAAAKASVEAARKLPAYPPLSQGGPINASALAGKLVYLIKYTDQPYNNFEAQAQVDGLQLAGVRTRVVSGDGTPQSWAAGINAAVADHANGINLLGMDPASVAPQIRAAQNAGIIVTSSNSYGTPQQMPDPIKDGGVTGTWYQNAKLMFDAAVADAGGSINALYMTSNDVRNEHTMAQAIQDEQKRLCTGCKITTANQPVSKWSEIPNTVAAALTKDPTINYVMLPFDSTIPYAQTGIRQAGKSPSQVKIVSGNASAEILKQITPGGQVIADPGAGVTWMGAAVAANMLRVLGGGQPTIYELQARLFDQTNVAEAGNPPSYLEGFGDRQKWLDELSGLLQK